MIVPVHYWSVRLVCHPARASLQFLHESQATGFQVLDDLYWPLSPDVRTEAGYLSELYQGTLDLWSMRK